MNITQIEIALSQKIDSNTSNLDLLTYSKALSYLKTNGIFTASNYGNLPSAASNEGKLYFVEDLEILFWSDGTDWLQLLSKSAIEFQLWSWGGNCVGTFSNSLLADGTTAPTVLRRCSPVQEISSSTNWCQVSAGYLHSHAIKTSGELWGWGNQSSGRLANGINNLTSQCSPVREICSATDWCQVSTGVRSAHSSAIKTSGELWSWGNGTLGKIGDGITLSPDIRTSPVREFCSSTNWCQVTVGSRHTNAIKTSGELWGWGCSLNIGEGTSVACRCSPVREICSATDWCQVSAGDLHTLAIKTSGELWGWGNGTAGVLGNGLASGSNSPVREFCSATNWCQVSGGFATTIAIKTSGELWGWGCGNAGRLGTGTITNRCSPVREFYSATDWCQASAGSAQGLAIKTSGELWGWGSNFNGRVGDGTLTDRCSPVREFCSATTWVQVSAGFVHSTAIKIT